VKSHAICTSGQRKSASRENVKEEKEREKNRRWKLPSGNHTAKGKGNFDGWGRGGGRHRECNGDLIAIVIVKVRANPGARYSLRKQTAPVPGANSPRSLSLSLSRATGSNPQNQARARARVPFRKTRVAVCSIRGRYWREFNADLKASRPRIEKEGGESKKRKRRREREKGKTGSTPFLSEPGAGKARR
jgi:hypothetical protein